MGYDEDPDYSKLKFILVKALLGENQAPGGRYSAAAGLRQAIDALVEVTVRKPARERRAPTLGARDRRAGASRLREVRPAYVWVAGRG